ncbi:DUF2163 domain-containing protein [Phaeospirillum tilakii]|uniref:DUF2163 domain-containing protein n=1 Tax=Phaeospirillum tilakii TaxID=741673 RepID=A0ABW5CDC9_9PROT
MIDVSPALKTLLAERRPHRVFDLWTIALPCGLTLHWTSADIALTVDGQTYGSDLRITRDKCRLTTGVETASQQMTLSPDAGAEPLIAGIPLRQALRVGMFDGAAVRLTWAYYDLATPPGLIGTLLRFTGFVGDIDCFAAKSVLTINSPLKRLDLQIPWRVYGAGCRWVLGDVGCGVDLAAHATAGTVLPGSSNGYVVTNIAAGAWAGGTLALTSGEDATFRRAVRAADGGKLLLKTPLPWAPQPGDTCLLTPGCDKTQGTATGCGRFDNVLRYGGMPYIPSPETAY